MKLIYTYLSMIYDNKNCPNLHFQVKTLNNSQKQNMKTECTKSIHIAKKNKSKEALVNRKKQICFKEI